METQQLRYFVAVARAGSFVRAADLEGIAQPSLSQQIRKLEGELGVSLFDRLGRSVKLTLYGEKLLEHAEAVLRDMREAKRAVEALKDENAGKVRVGVIPTVLPYALVEPLAQFRDRNAGIEIELVEGITEEVVDALRRGEIDIAVVALPIRHQEIVCSELFREKLVAAIPKGHSLARETTVALKKLGGERMLLLREGHCLRDNVLTVCTRAKMEFQQVFESDHLESILRLVGQGFGVSLVPERCAQGRTDCEFRELDQASFRRVGYVIAKGHCVLPARTRLAKFLKSWPWGSTSLR